MLNHKLLWSDFLIEVMYNCVYCIIMSMLCCDEIYFNFHHSLDILQQDLCKGYDVSHSDSDSGCFNLNLAQHFR